MSKRKAHKVLLIGWDAADWNVINPLLDAGKMPALEKLVDAGVMGNLATLDPPMSPMLWTSIASGKTADQHGILGFTQPDPEGTRLQPVLSTSRKVKAIWNILMQEGLKANVVGWWPGHPAEPINGVYVSNFYQKMHTPLHMPNRLAPGTVHPRRLEETLAELRIHPGELTAAHLTPFVPEAASIDQDKDRRLYTLAKIIAEASTVHAAATYIMETEEWDFMAMYYDAIDHFGHAFMNFHPPRIKGVPEDQFELYQGVVNGGYIFHDMMLERLLELAGDDTTVILISDHGFHSDELRPRRLPQVPAGPAVQHRPYGIIAMKGEGIQQDERIYGASLLDITPTILHLFGLPIGRDMQGKPLIQAFEQPRKAEFIPSWEAVPGDCGMHSSEIARDPWAEQAGLDQLVALGYIDPPDENIAVAIEKSVRESKFYLARVYLDSNRPAEALPILEELYKEYPEEKRFGMWLLECYLGLQRSRDGLRMIDELRNEAPKITPSMDLLRGKLLLLENRTQEALEYLKKAEKADSSLPGLFIDVGNVYLRLTRWNDAEAAFGKALDHDIDSAPSHHGLGIALLRQRHFRDAAEALLTAIGLRFFFPFAHFHFGEALIHLQHYERAAEALEVCLSQAPGIEKARQLLVKLYNKRLNQPEKARAHLQCIEENI